MYKRLSERLLNVFLKKLDVSEQRILYLKQTDFDDKQQDDKNTYSLELFIIGAVNHTRHISFLQFGNIIIQCSFRIAGIIYMNVLTLPAWASSLHICSFRAVITVLPALSFR